MKAKMMVITNADEIAKARELASKDEKVVVPERTVDYTDFLFDPKRVSLSYIGSNGDIRIIYDGQDLTLKYDKEIFKQLEDNFKNR